VEVKFFNLALFFLLGVIHSFSYDEAYTSRPNDTLKGIIRYHYIKNSLDMSFSEYKESFFQKNKSNLKLKNNNLHVGTKVLIPIRRDLEIEKKLGSSFRKNESIWNEEMSFEYQKPKRSLASLQKKDLTTKVNYGIKFDLILKKFLKFKHDLD